MALLHLRLRKSAESRIRAGHPWVFAESIREQNRAGASGEIAVLFDSKDQFLAAGLFDAGSPIRVRILQRGSPELIDRDWLRRRIMKSVQRREGLFDAGTTGCRLAYGESDGLPALVLDAYEKTRVLKLYSAAWLPWLPELVPILESVLGGERLVLRMSRNMAEAAAATGLADGQVLSGPPIEGPVVFRESGLRFEADVARGQKTGFFLDQRENRKRVGALSAGRRVLNAFSFTGGFSLYAARGGASEIVDLDISGRALEGSRRNFQLNQDLPSVARCRHETIQADAFEWLGSPAGKPFGLVVLDPPALAKKRAERLGALRAYGKLAAMAVRRLERGGILVAASCSAHVKVVEFEEQVRRAVEATGRQIQVLERTGHPADHWAAFDEAEYLKCLFLKVKN